MHPLITSYPTVSRYEVSSHSESFGDHVLSLEPSERFFIAINMIYVYSIFFASYRVPSLILPNSMLSHRCKCTCKKITTSEISFSDKIAKYNVVANCCLLHGVLFTVFILANLVTIVGLNFNWLCYLF